MSATESCEGGTTSFTYIDQKVQALGQLVDSKEMQSEFFELFGKRMKKQLSYLPTSVHSGATEAGRLFLVQSFNVSIFP